MSLPVGAVLRRDAVISASAEDLTVESVDDSLFGVTQARRILNEGIQHGLQLEGRATDHLEDVARGGLLVEGLGEVSVSTLQLREQPDVLDGDGGLVGEGRQEGNVLL